jgi:hypothetical protein
MRAVVRSSLRSVPNGCKIKRESGMGEDCHHI